MNKFETLVYRSLRKAFMSIRLKTPELRVFDNDADSVAKTIENLLNSERPGMIARFGSTEMSCLLNYTGVKQKKVLAYFKGDHGPFWWDKRVIEQMQRWSGFFPATEENVELYGALLMEDMKELDVLGSWLEGELMFKEELENVEKVRLIYLDPFWSKIPWTKALKGKKVLVIHPFTESIEKQYQKKDVLFKNGLLPHFELKTIKAVQSLAGNETPFATWFEALDWMKQQMDQLDYDICLVGAGAYGFHLAAHAKRMGKKGFHMGGSLQLLFGIKGKRWESPDYAKALNLNYPSLFNEHWIRPSESETFTNANKVEDSCYW